MLDPSNIQTTIWVFLTFGTVLAAIGYATGVGYLLLGLQYDSWPTLIWCFSPVYILGAWAIGNSDPTAYKWAWIFIGVWLTLYALAASLLGEKLASLFEDDTNDSRRILRRLLVRALFVFFAEVSVTIGFGFLKATVLNLELEGVEIRGNPGFDALVNAQRKIDEDDFSASAKACKEFSGRLESANSTKLNIHWSFLAHIIRHADGEFIGGAKQQLVTHFKYYEDRAAAFPGPSINMNFVEWEAPSGTSCIVRVYPINSALNLDVVDVAKLKDAVEFQIANFYGLAKAAQSRPASLVAFIVGSTCELAGLDIVKVEPEKSESHLEILLTWLHRIFAVFIVVWLLQLGKKKT